VGVVVAWALLLAVLALWSAGHNAPTVPEQRDIAQALPYLDRAAGAMLAAADADGRAVVLGARVLDRDCHVTPLRPGVQGLRDVTVHVRADRAAATFDGIAAALPAAFHARVRHSPAGTQHDLYADAGGFVAIDATARSDDTTFTMRASTGCRPLAGGVDLDPSDPPVTAPPAAFGTAVAALGGASTDATGREAPCPAGGVARTVVSGQLPAPRDLGVALTGIVPTAAVVEADPRQWAYRDGGVSIVVTEAAGHARVSATIGCR
jgi:hypothetical protein